jgi:hypothetical protein
MIQTAITYFKQMIQATITFFWQILLEYSSNGLTRGFPGG